MKVTPSASRCCSWARLSLDRRRRRPERSADRRPRVQLARREADIATSVSQRSIAQLPVSRRSIVRSLACPAAAPRSSIHQQGSKQNATDNQRNPPQFISVESKPSPPSVVPTSDGELHRGTRPFLLLHLCAGGRRFTASGLGERGVRHRVEVDPDCGVPRFTQWRTCHSPIWRLPQVRLAGLRVDPRKYSSSHRKGHWHSFSFDTRTSMRRAMPLTGREIVRQDRPPALYGPHYTLYRVDKS